ncbi:MAG: guanylate kinase [Planctomycetales bacterium 12-60-4]|nr:MAG: guanylate kinase [Planctomycetales bacterium 12-60-4]
MSASPAASDFQVVVLSGPSGSGKTTIVERLLASAPVRLVKSVSATTRAPRAGEQDGLSYHFLTSEEFARRREHGEFLETAEVYPGLCYGTLKSELERAREQGGWSFLEIDVEGALNVMAAYPDAVTIFLSPPSMEVCEQRLRARGTETEEVLQRRLAKVASELSFAPRYRHQVVNDDLEHAINEIQRILDSYRNTCHNAGSAAGERPAS